MPGQKSLIGKISWDINMVCQYEYWIRELSLYTEFDNTGEIL